MCKEVFDEADEALGLKISDICFNEDERLNETEYTQPAILTMSVAVLKLMEEKGLKLTMLPVLVLANILLTLQVVHLTLLMQFSL